MNLDDAIRIFNLNVLSPRRGESKKFNEARNRLLEAGIQTTVITPYVTMEATQEELIEIGGAKPSGFQPRPELGIVLDDGRVIQKTLYDRAVIAAQIAAQGNGHRLTYRRPKKCDIYCEAIIRAIHDFCNAHQYEANKHELWNWMIERPPRGFNIVWNQKMKQFEIPGERPMDWDNYRKRYDRTLYPAQ
jgi:hypothetical protein